MRAPTSSIGLVQRLHMLVHSTLGHGKLNTVGVHVLQQDFDNLSPAALFVGVSGGASE